MCAWKNYPIPEVPSPVLALTGWRNQLWAGGAGGAAHYFDSEWRLSPNLPLASCSSLVFSTGVLLAGGADGLAQSMDGGRTWERAAITGVFEPVMDLAVSPNFHQDQVALAGTLGGGILRSDNGGKSWKYENFGLKNLEVLCLAWQEGETVLAGTEDGIYRSTNSGQAWRATLGAEHQAAAGLLYLADGSVLAAMDGGRLLRSDDGGARWSEMETQGLPEESEVQSLALAPWGALLLSVSEMGVFQSTDGGAQWQLFLQENVLDMAVSDGRLYAGLEYGAAEISTDGLQPLPTPPLHDLRTLMVYRQAPIVTGLHSRAWIYAKKEGWRALLDESEAITVISEAPDGALLLSCSRGLLRSKDSGKTWETVMEGEAGVVALITFRQNGFGWAASADGARLLRTRDHGKTWEALPAPFGGVPVAALQSTSRMLMAATYDPQRATAKVMFSIEDGQSWQPGPKVQTTWPVITALAHPPLLTLSGVMSVLQPNGTWNHHQLPGGGGIRRVAGSGKLLMALTTAGLYQSTDRGASWEMAEDCPEHQFIVDMALTDDGLYLLLTGGELIMRPHEK